MQRITGVGGYIRTYFTPGNEHMCTLNIQNERIRESSRWVGRRCGARNEGCAKTAGQILTDFQGLGSGWVGGWECGELFRVCWATTSPTDPSRCRGVRLLTDVVGGLAWVETPQMIPTGFAGRVLGGSGGGGGGGWGTMRAVVREGREFRDSCLD